MQGERVDRIPSKLGRGECSGGMEEGREGLECREPLSFYYTYTSIFFKHFSKHCVVMHYFV